MNVKRKKEKGHFDIGYVVVILIFLFLGGAMVFTRNPLGMLIQEKLGIEFYIDDYLNKKSPNKELERDKEILADEDNQVATKKIGDDLSDEEYNQLLEQANKNKEERERNSNKVEYFKDEDGNFVERTYFAIGDGESVASDSSYANNTTTAKKHTTTTENTTETTTEQVTEATTAENGGAIVNEDGELTYEINQDAFNNASSTASKYPDVVNGLLVEINNKRASNGIGQVSIDTTLNNMAGYRVYDMAKNNYFDHYKDGISQLRVVMYAFDRLYSGKHSENIGHGVDNDESGVAVRMVESWESSPTHYEVMMDGSYTKIGIAVTKSNSGAWYICTIYSN